MGEGSAVLERPSTSLEIGEADDAEWDAFLRAHPDGHHEQCAAYGVHRGGFGFSRDRVVVRERGRVVGGVQVLARTSPVGICALVQRGPLAVDNRFDILTRAAEALDELARRRGYVSIRVDTFPAQTGVRSALERAGYRSSEVWIPTFDTLIVPLDGDDDARLARMASKGRYNVRLAQRSGVTIAAEGAAGLDDFYALHLLTAEHQDFPVLSRAYYDELWRVFGPSGRVEVLTARLDGTPIASIILCVAGERCYYGWGGMSREPEHRKRMPNYLLHFRGMAWARERGCSVYDLVGTSDFKDKLGGDPLRWPPAMRKYFGVWRGLRRWAADWSWRTPFARRMVERVARRLYPRMPY